MWAGISTTSRMRAQSSPLSRSPSWTIIRVFVMFCCTFLVVVDIDIVTSMSLDRLALDRNSELQSDKKTDNTDNKNKKSELIVEDLGLEAVAAGVDTEMYVLFPAGSKSERGSVDKNIIESAEAESTNEVEVGSDMIMMESNDKPVHIAYLPVSEIISQIGKEIKSQKTVTVDGKKNNEDVPTILDENDDESINQVFKNDKDIEDMAFENESGKDSVEDIETGDAKDESGEEPESMVEMLADVVEEVEQAIETELVGEETDNKINEKKDEEKDEWEATVEKLEEKVSEKNKANENDNQLETAAVMEEILPDDIVEAMALAETSNSSNEEKDEDEKEKEKIQIQNIKSESTDAFEKKQISEKIIYVKNESDKNHEKDSIENPTKDEDKNNELDSEKVKLDANTDTDMPKLEKIPTVENIETEEFKGEKINLPAKEMETVSVISEDDNKEHIGDSNLITEKSETLLDSLKEPIKLEYQSLNPSEEEKEEANKKHEDNVVESEHTSNEVEATVEKESDIIAETNFETDDIMQSEVLDNAEKIEGSNRIEDTRKPLDNAEEYKQETPFDIVEPPKAVSMLQVDEEPLPIPSDIKENEHNKDEEIETMESAIGKMKPMEYENGEIEEIQSMKPMQFLMNNYEENIKFEDEQHKTPINSDGSLNVPEEISLFTQIPQNSEEEITNANDAIAETTTLRTILQIPDLQQPQEQQLQQLQQNELQQNLQQEVTHNAMHSADSKGPNEQIISDVVEATQMTVESSTPNPQTVVSATQDIVLNYVNVTNVMQTLNGEKEQQKQEAMESDTETPFNSQLRRYDGAQVWRIVVQNDRDRRLADELQSKYDGQLWKEIKQEVDYLLKPQVLAAAEKHIREANLSRIVLIDNLQQVIEVENPPLDEFADADSEKGYRLTWHAYHRLADIHDFYDYLAKTYHEICSVETIGYSVERRPLKVLKISNGNAGNPGVWIDGGMHAREWISPASVTYIAHQLAEGWEDLPSHMKRINWYIHAVANPDGYEYTHTTDRLWRKNMRSHGRQCPGVDLNRNFGFKWGGKGTSANPCSQTYRGTKAFSEPETFYISKFISGFPRDTFQAFLSFHSYGQYILYPWGYDYALTNDKSDLDRVARAAATTITRSSGSKYTVGPSAVTLYPAAGGSDDWARGIANIKYTYTIEMGDNGRYGFILPASFIETNGKDAYTFVQTVARAISHDVRKRNIKLK